MDFSSLAKEIEAKKALAKSLKNNDQKRSYLTRAEINAKEEELSAGTLKRKHEEQEESEDNKLANNEDEEEDGKRNKILKQLNEYKDKLKLEELEERASIVSKEDQTLLDSITDEELSKKLETFGLPPWDKDETKIEAIRRLNSYTRQKDEEIKKQEQIRYENEIDFHIIPDDIRDDSDKVYVQLRSYLKYLLQQWDQSVEQTDEQQVKLLSETKKSLVPLLVKLRQKALEKEVFTSLSTTMKYLQDKNYLMSNDAYLNLSIGNTCWPIGVINIGIHARSAHSRLTGMEKKSNMMSDEKTRRWLMGIKRLITFAEKKWPN